MITYRICILIFLFEFECLVQKNRRRMEWRDNGTINIWWTFSSDLRGD